MAKRSALRREGALVFKSAVRWRCGHGAADGFNVFGVQVRAGLVVPDLVPGAVLRLLRDTDDGDNRIGRHSHENLAVGRRGGADVHIIRRSHAFGLRRDDKFLHVGGPLGRVALRRAAKMVGRKDRRHGAAALGDKHGDLSVIAHGAVPCVVLPVERDLVNLAAQIDGVLISRCLAGLFIVGL